MYSYVVLFEECNSKKTCRKTYQDYKHKEYFNALWTLEAPIPFNIYENSSAAQAPLEKQVSNGNTMVL